MIPENYTLSSYSNNTDTDLVNDSVEVVLRSIVIANTNASSRTVIVKLTDGASAERARLLPSTAIPAGASYTLDFGSLSLKDTDKVMVQASGADVHFTATGARSA